MIRPAAATLSLLAGTAAAAATPPAPAATPLPSLAGSGLFTVPDTATLAPRRFTVGLALDNRDRDPLGLDLFDYAVAWGAGIRPRLEAYGRWVFSRVASLPEAPALPPPPLDVVVLSGPAPQPPYYAIHPAVPYVNKRGTARLGAFVPGDAVVGLKQRVVEQRAARPALALAAEVKVPLTKDHGHLQSGSGTGAVDATLRLAAQWRRGRHDLVASAGYTRTGRPPLGDRLIVPAASGAFDASDRPLELPDCLALDLGIRRALGRRWAAVLEGAAELDVGGRTATVDRDFPLDVVAGVQARLGRARVSLGLRYHGHSPPSGTQRASPVAGLVDVSAVDPEVLVDWLRGAGAAGAVPHLRAGGQRLLAGVPGGLDLPEGARLLPAAYALRSEHQLGFVVVWAWAF